MTIYKVTTELKTTWWLRLLRFLRIKGRRVEFEIFLNTNGYLIGETLHTNSSKFKILSKESREGSFVNNLGYC